MHEMSLALEICRIAELEVGSELLPRVVEVGVEVGTEAGVEPDNLEFCLGALLEKPPFGRGRPVLEHVSGDDLRVTYLEIDESDDASVDDPAPGALPLETLA